MSLISLEFSLFNPRNEEHEIFLAWKTGFLASKVFQKIIDLRKRYLLQFHLKIRVSDAPGIGEQKRPIQ